MSVSLEQVLQRAGLTPASVMIPNSNFYRFGGRGSPEGALPTTRRFSQTRESIGELKGGIKEWLRDPLEALKEKRDREKDSIEAIRMGITGNEQSLITRSAQSLIRKRTGDVQTNILILQFRVQQFIARHISAMSSALGVSRFKVPKEVNDPKEGWLGKLFGSFIEDLKKNPIVGATTTVGKHAINVGRILNPFTLAERTRETVKSMGEFMQRLVMGDESFEMMKDPNKLYEKAGLKQDFQTKSLNLMKINNEYQKHQLDMLYNIALIGQKILSIFGGTHKMTSTGITHDEFEGTLKTEKELAQSKFAREMTLLSTQQKAARKGLFGGVLTDTYSGLKQVGLSLQSTINKNVANEHDINILKLLYHHRGAAFEGIRGLSPVLDNFVDSLDPNIDWHNPGNQGVMNTFKRLVNEVLEQTPPDSFKSAHQRFKMIYEECVRTSKAMTISKTPMAINRLFANQLADLTGHKVMTDQETRRKYDAFVRFGGDSRMAAIHRGAAIEELQRDYIENHSLLATLSRAPLVGSLLMGNPLTGGIASSLISGRQQVEVARMQQQYDDLRNNQYRDLNTDDIFGYNRWAPPPGEGSGNPFQSTLSVKLVDVSEETVDKFKSILTEQRLELVSGISSSLTSGISALGSIFQLTFRNLFLGTNTSNQTVLEAFGNRFRAELTDFSTRLSSSLRDTGKAIVDYLFTKSKEELDRKNGIAVINALENDTTDTQGGSGNGNGNGGRPPQPNASGGVYSGGNISDYSNTIVSQPTLFRYQDVHQFAKGGDLLGVVGETRQPEAILPTQRDEHGVLGVRALPPDQFPIVGLEEGITSPSSISKVLPVLPIVSTDGKPQVLSSTESGRPPVDATNIRPLERKVQNEPVSNIQATPERKEIVDESKDNVETAAERKEKVDKIQEERKAQEEKEKAQLTEDKQTTLLEQIAGYLNPKNIQGRLAAYWEKKKEKGFDFSFAGDLLKKFGIGLAAAGIYKMIPADVKKKIWDLTQRISSKVFDFVSDLSNQAFESIKGFAKEKLPSILSNTWDFVKSHPLLTSGTLATFFPGTIGKIIANVAGPIITKFPMAIPFALGVGGMVYNLLDSYEKAKDKDGNFNLGTFLKEFFIGSDSGLKSALGKAGTWGLIGAGIGAAFGGIGAIPGFLVGSALGAFIGDLNSKDKNGKFSFGKFLSSFFLGNNPGGGLLNTGSNAIKWGLAGAGIGALFGGVGALPGFIAGAAVGAVLGSVNPKDEKGEFSFSKFLKGLFTRSDTKQKLGGVVDPNTLKWGLVGAAIGLPFGGIGAIPGFIGGAAIGTILSDVVNTDSNGFSFSKFLKNFFTGGNPAGGLLNAGQQAVKWGLIGAAIGLPFGGVGAIPGFLAGSALGGLLGYVGSDNITKFWESVNSGEDVAKFFGWKTGSMAYKLATNKWAQKLPMLGPFLFGTFGKIFDLGSIAINKIGEYINELIDWVKKKLPWGDKGGQEAAKKSQEAANKKRNVEVVNPETGEKVNLTQEEAGKVNKTSDKKKQAEQINKYKEQHKKEDSWRQQAGSSNYDPDKYIALRKKWEAEEKEYNRRTSKFIDIPNSLFYKGKEDVSNIDDFKASEEEANEYNRLKDIAQKSGKPDDWDTAIRYARKVKADLEPYKKKYEESLKARESQLKEIEIGSNPDDSRLRVVKQSSSIPAAESAKSQFSNEKGDSLRVAFPKYFNPLQKTPSKPSEAFKQLSDSKTSEVHQLNNADSLLVKQENTLTSNPGKTLTSATSKLEPSQAQSGSFTNLIRKGLKGSIKLGKDLADDVASFFDRRRKTRKEERVNKFSLSDIGWLSRSSDKSSLSSKILYDDTHGTTYGKYHLGSIGGKKSPMGSFLVWALKNGGPEGRKLYERMFKVCNGNFNNLDTGSRSGDVVDEWRSAVFDGTVNDLENKYIANKYYESIIPKLSPEIQDLINKSKTLQQVLVSTATQYDDGNLQNPAHLIFEQAYNPGMTIENYISNIYSLRNRGFRGKNREKILKQYNIERNKALLINEFENDPTKDITSLETGLYISSKVPESTPPEIRKYLSVMENNIADGTATFSLTDRMKENVYDCSSFVARSLNSAGYPVDPQSTTWQLGESLQNAGFKFHKLVIEPGTSQAPSELKAGDVLLSSGNRGWENHVETYYGNNKIIGAHSTTSGVNIKDFYSTGYPGYWRLETTTNGSSPEDLFKTGSITGDFNVFSNYPNVTAEDIENWKISPSTKMVWPTDSTVVTSPMGPRSGGYLNGALISSQHGGIDIHAPAANPIYSAMSGMVIGTSPDYGTVEIKHPGGWKTKYLHLGRFTVKAGQKVKAGDVIGESGGIGHDGRQVYTPHLHFEMLKDGVRVDPETVYDTYRKASPTPKLPDHNQIIQNWGKLGKGGPTEKLVPKVSSISAAASAKKEIGGPPELYSSHSSSNSTFPSPQLPSSHQPISIPSTPQLTPSHQPILKPTSPLLVTPPSQSKTPDDKSKSDVNPFVNLPSNYKAGDPLPPSAKTTVNPFTGQAKVPEPAKKDEPKKEEPKTPEPTKKEEPKKKEPAKKEEPKKEQSSPVVGPNMPSPNTTSAAAAQAAEAAAKQEDEKSFSGLNWLEKLIAGVARSAFSFMGTVSSAAGGLSGNQTSTTTNSSQSGVPIPGKGAVELGNKEYLPGKPGQPSLGTHIIKTRPLNPNSRPGRNNNPLNVKAASKQVKQDSGKHIIFENPDDGIRGAYWQLQRYITGKTTGQILNTPRLIIQTWAPADDGNNHRDYFNTLVKHGVDLDWKIDLTTPEGQDRIAKLMSGMAVAEASWKISPQEIKEVLSYGGQRQEEPAAGQQNLPNNTPAAVQKYLSVMVKNARGATYKLDEKLRMAPHTYDCSSFVSRSLSEAGFNIAPNTNTAGLGAALKRNGFIFHPLKLSPGLTRAPAELIPGDILLNYGNGWHNHTETYFGNQKIIGAHSDRNGVSVKDFYSTGYPGYWRLKDAHGSSPEDLYKGGTLLEGSDVYKNYPNVTAEDANRWKISPSTKMVWPTDSRLVTSHMQPRDSGVTSAGGQISKQHGGIDIHAPAMSAIYAAMPGVVSATSPDYGTIEITHPDGWRTRYLHLQRFTAKTGDQVKAGDVIGESGGTGPSGSLLKYQPHLHFEMLKDGVRVDPEVVFQTHEKSSPSSVPFDKKQVLQNANALGLGGPNFNPTFKKEIGSAPSDNNLRLSWALSPSQAVSSNKAIQSSQLPKYGSGVVQSESITSPQNLANNSNAVAIISAPSPVNSISNALPNIPTYQHTDIPQQKIPKITILEKSYLTSQKLEDNGKSKFIDTVDRPNSKSNRIKENLNTVLSAKQSQGNFNTDETSDQTDDQTSTKQSSGGVIGELKKLQGLMLAMIKQNTPNVSLVSPVQSVRNDGNEPKNKIVDDDNGEMDAMINNAFSQIGGLMSNINIATTGLGTAIT